MSPRPRRPSPWAKRFEDRTKSNPLLVLLFFASTWLSAIIVLVGAAIYFADQFDQRFDWRDDEYRVIENLHAGFTRAKFADAFGTAVFDRRRGRFREQTFRRREYWVQIVSDRAGVVVLYSVTACSPEFRPRFPIPGSGGPSDPVASVELNSSTVAAPIQGHDANFLRLNYFGSGATANSRFYETYGGGNPSNYKTFVWGLNDVCGDWFDVYHSFYEQNLFPKRKAAYFRGFLGTAPRWTKRFRLRAIVNTYAETAPGFILARHLRGTFQIGADRLLTRTAADPDARVDSP